MYQDEKLVCEDCGAEFVFTAGEQEFYAEKTTENTEKCMKQYALNAELKHRFHLNLFRAKKSFAKIAS